MGQRHVERVNPRHPRIEQDRAFVAPVDLGLRAGDDFEPVVQPVQARRGVVVAGEPLAASATWSLTPLVVPVEAVLGDEPLVDHRRRDGGQRPKNRPTPDPNGVDTATAAAGMRVGSGSLLPPTAPSRPRSTFLTLS
jgi:hypothetical protein